MVAEHRKSAKGFRIHLDLMNLPKRCLLSIFSKAKLQNILPRLGGV
jgi:hypothetical protein